MLHTVRRATSRSAGNLKQQDKCDNLSAFWPVAAAAARTKRTGAATSSPAPAPTPWHATTNSHKLLVLQQRNRETERGRESVWHILHSIKLMSSKMEKQQRQQQAVAINACHAPPPSWARPLRPWHCISVSQKLLQNDVGRRMLWASLLPLQLLLHIQQQRRQQFAA